MTKRSHDPSDPDSLAGFGRMAVFGISLDKHSVDNFSASQLPIHLHFSLFTFCMAWNGASMTMKAHVAVWHGSRPCKLCLVLSLYTSCSLAHFLKFQ